MHNTEVFLSFSLFFFLNESSFVFFPFVMPYFRFLEKIPGEMLIDGACINYCIHGRRTGTGET